MRKPYRGIFDCMDKEWGKVLMQLNFENLEKEIGYVFKDKLLIKRALTHTSYENEQKINKNGHYERLEFLGDAVLELLSSEYIYEKNPDMGEGKMTKLRAAIVCEVSLAKSAEQICLSEYIYLGKGESRTGGRNRDSIVADVMEAVIGALYLDGGISVAREFVRKFILNDIEQKSLFYDAKSNLQEYVQQNKLGIMKYELLDERGPEHKKEFECAVCLDDKRLGVGVGNNKKEAEQKAAYEALLILKKQ